MKMELMSLSIVLASHDYMDPQMKMNQGTEEKGPSRKVEIKQEVQTTPKKIVVEEKKHGKRHKLLSWWSKDQKRKYGMDKGLCLYCFTDNHRAASCPLLAVNGTAKKVIVAPKDKESLELQTKVLVEILNEYQRLSDEVENINEDEYEEVGKA
eukprot:snap_masked-scaffold_70-processed-gene-0.23-mRNA-1 protein AED:1.00 eAED:1.00 QI:0/-1/0/0/-1/1/1/0/152